MNNAGSATKSAAILGGRIADRSARVGIIGLGYVGMPTLVAVAGSGFHVTGIDISESRVGQVSQGTSYISDVPSDILAELVRSRRISATTDYSVINDLDVIVVCVPTPITKHKEPDLRPILDAIGGVAAQMKSGQLVILQSTTFPGTTEELALPILQKSGLQVGEEFFLAFALERIDPGNPDLQVHNVPKVVGGISSECTRLATEFLSAFVDRVIPVSSPRIAEMTKLLENTFRSVNIALVNELAMVCHRMDIDIWEVIEAASTKPIGFMPFYPGPGVGGHCIPVDPFYLSWKAREHDFYVNFIELAARINDNMPYYTVSRITDILSEHGKAVNGANLLMLGQTFKEEISDIRNSPAIRVAEILVKKGATISYSDYNIPEVEIHGEILHSVELTSAALRRFDAAIVLVAHSKFDLAFVADNSKLLIDTKNATAGLRQRLNVAKV